jgi:hypothetical protein
MRAIALLLVALLAPVLLAGCQSRVFQVRQPLPERVVGETCTPIPPR